MPADNATEPGIARIWSRLRIRDESIAFLLMTFRPLTMHGKPFRQRVTEVSRKLSDEPLKRCVETVRSMESTRLGNVADFHRRGRE